MSKVHFTGIGGVAMIGGAYLAKQLGHEVKGSDNPLYPPTSILAKQLNVPIYTGYSASNLDWNPDYVIIGNALSRGNAEVEEVLNRRLRFYSLPEWLRLEILSNRIPIVISGTHGKTTTTSLVAWILKKNNYNPGYLIGGMPLGFEFPAEVGQPGGYFVIEGDEYDTAFFDKRPKFLHYLPQILAVTSIEFDHSDIYNNIEEIRNAFRLLFRVVPEKGVVIINSNIEIQYFKPHILSYCETFGYDEGSVWRCIPTKDKDTHEMLVDIRYKEKSIGIVRAKLIGRHNALNIVCATAICHHIGLDFEQIRTAIETFQGVRRRQEVFLQHKGNIYIDDFAHHPTAIRETLYAIRDKYPNKKLIAIFEPRSNTTVTNLFQKELGESLSIADEVWITPIYREEKIQPDKRLDKEQLRCDITKQGKICRCACDFAEIYQYLTKQIEDNSVIVLMSNGACGNLRQQLEQAYKSNTSQS